MNYASYIQSTDEINKFLCQMSLSSNYSLNIKKEDDSETELDSTNKELLQSLNVLRLGELIDENIRSFINTNSEYMKILNGEVPNLLNSEPFVVYKYLIGVANQFKEKFKKLNNGSTILDEYIDPINKYYLTLCEKSIVQCTKKLFFNTNLNSSLKSELFESNNTSIISEKFPHLLTTITQKNYGPNNFFKLYYYVSNFYNSLEEQKTTELNLLENISKVYAALQVYKS